MRLRVLIVIAVLAGSTGQAQKTPFSADSVRAPLKLLDFATTDGTWIGVDVSPDGRRTAERTRVGSTRTPSRPASSTGFGVRRPDRRRLTGSSLGHAQVTPSGDSSAVLIPRIGP